MTFVEYMRGDINNVYSMLEGKNSALKSGGDGNRTYPSLYSPYLDVTNELDAELNNRFQHLI